jgi:hypothetical protein
LLHSKCISSEDYHTFKRPLLQRLTILGEEINSQDMKVRKNESVVPTQAATQEAARSTVQKDEEEEWSVIDLQDPVTENPSEKTKHKNPIKKFIKPYKSSKNKEKKYNNVVLVPENETKPSVLANEKGKRREREGGERKGRNLDGFKKRRKSDGQEEEAQAPCLDQFERFDFFFFI